MARALSIAAHSRSNAINSPAIAQALAAHYRLPHLDTGLLYRAVGRQVALSRGDPDSPAKRQTPSRSSVSRTRDASVRRSRGLRLATVRSMA